MREVGTCPFSNIHLNKIFKMIFNNSIELTPRYLTFTASEFAAGPAQSGLLTQEESFAILMNISAPGEWEEISLDEVARKFKLNLFYRENNDQCRV